MKTALTLLMTALTLTACGPKLTFTGFEPIDQSYVVDGGNFNTGGLVAAAAKARNYDGRLVLCGAWTKTVAGEAAENYDVTVLREGRIRINGETILSDLRRLNQVELRDTLVGERAACFSTGQNFPSQGANVQVLFIQMRDNLDQGRSITFAPGNVPDLLTAPAPVQTAPDPDVEDPNKWKRAS